MPESPAKIGVMTSGGDAPGMNAAVRSVVRTALDRGVEVYAIYRGYEGMVAGGQDLRKMDWEAVSGILQLGGTAIGTARCEAFREREGRLQAARHLLECGIGGLIVIGGDGSLTGAQLLSRDWASLADELVRSGAIPRELAERHPQLKIVGLVGSIDNDLTGTDTTIGADTALRRITDAVDAISSTAASHQRSFVVEVMGRDCGYLALMGALATGASWAIIPEDPPEPGEWETQMCQALGAAREAGHRDSIVLVAEGARDRDGRPISSTYVKQVLEEQLGLDTRVTILGHMQRGGSPSAFDRYMSTVLGHAAVERILSDEADGEPCIIGMRGNRITSVPLDECIQQKREIIQAIERNDSETAVRLRGGSFEEALDTLRTLSQALPGKVKPEGDSLRLAVLNAAALAPGMNTATRAAVRLGLDEGHVMVGVRNGFRGLIKADFEEMDWTSVQDWAGMGGSELGTSRKIPSGGELYAIARNLEEHRIQGLLIIGGWSGYQAASELYQYRSQYPAFNLPIICLPASIDNNLPGSELSIGADTALNNIVDAVDKIKQSAVASSRTFVVEVMGRYCGYLALMSGLATGAERVYINEEGVTLSQLQEDVSGLIEGFQQGKRLGLVIRNEYANEIYTTGFISALFEEEGRGLFAVRQSILGHLQQGGQPSPFDRIQATRLASRCIRWLIEKAAQGQSDAAFMGLELGRVRFHELEDLSRMMDLDLQRPKEQWWWALRPIARMLAQRGPQKVQNKKWDGGTKK